MDRMAEVLEKIMRAARQHLADPDDPAKRDRLSAVVKEGVGLFPSRPGRSRRGHHTLSRPFTSRRIASRPPGSKSFTIGG